MYKTGVYKGKGRGQNTSNQTQTPKKQFNNNVTNRTQRREKEKAMHQPKERQPRRTRSPVKLKWADERRKELVSTVEKKDIWQMNA